MFDKGEINFITEGNRKFQKYSDKDEFTKGISRCWTCYNLCHFKKFYCGKGGFPIKSIGTCKNHKIENEYNPKRNRRR